MTDRELDAAIAEKVMGWGVRRMPRVPADSYHDPKSMCQFESPVPSFSTDRNAAALVLEEIGKLGLKKQWSIGMGATDYVHPISLAWQIATATPRQLMEAALAAVEASSKEPGSDTGTVHAGR